MLCGLLRRKPAFSLDTGVTTTICSPSTKTGFYAADEVDLSWQNGQNPE
jgi:hypothetical protein